MGSVTARSRLGVRLVQVVVLSALVVLPVGACSSRGGDRGTANGTVPAAVSTTTAPTGEGTSPSADSTVACGNTADCDDTVSFDAEVSEVEDLIDEIDDDLQQDQ